MLSQNIPIDLVEKIMLETFDVKKLYVLHVSYFYDSGMGNDNLDSKILCVSDNFDSIFEFIKKNYIFEDDQRFTKHLELVQKDNSKWERCYIHKNMNIFFEDLRKNEKTEGNIPPGYEWCVMNISEADVC